MLKLDSILFPTDFTEHAERAFAQAAHLAARHGADLCVLNVAAPHQQENNPMDYLPLEREVLPGREAEQLYLAPDAQHGGVHVHYRQVRRIAPAMAILEYADEHDVDLIVMGTRGRHGVERFLSASVAEEVVRQAKCPTLTVRTGEEAVPVRAVQRVLVPLDFSASARLQVAHAAALAEGYGAQVDLLHVIEEAVFPTVYGIDPGTPPTAEIEARSEEALRQLAEEVVAPGGLRAAVHVRTGHPVRDILAFADKQESDLVVMATHGRTGLERFLIGSVAEKVVRAASCPVFTVRPFGKSLVDPAAPDPLSEEGG